MLKHTFCHIPGVKRTLELNLWKNSFNTWEDCAGQEIIKKYSEQGQIIRKYSEKSKEEFKKNNIHFFSDNLPPGSLWRIYGAFRNKTAFFDIETTGLDQSRNEITTIVLYDGKKIKYFINGRNLDDFAEEITKYYIIVTYNGKAFDVPFIQKKFNITLQNVHIDLQYVLHNLGFYGGLKGAEKLLGIHRGDLDGLDGYFAVLLWNYYQEFADEKALEALLAYNIEDVLNLEKLMIISYNMYLKKTPFYKKEKIKKPRQPASPFKVDKRLIQKVKNHFRVN
jgi:hypothetical protein